MKKFGLLCGLAAASLAVAAPPKVVLSNIVGDPTNAIPGGTFWQAGDADTFDTIRISADGSRFAISGEQENGATDLDIVVLGTRVPFGLNAVVAREGDPTGFLAETWVLIRDAIAVGNDGTVAMAGDTNNVGTDDIVVSWFGGLPTLLGREGDPIPALGGTVFMGGANNGVNILNNGAVRWISTGLTGALPGQNQMAYEKNGASDTVLARSGITVPTNQGFAPDQGISTFNGADRLLSAAQSGDFYYPVTLLGPSTSNVGYVLNNAMTVQEGVIPSGSGFATAPTSMSSGPTHALSSNGAYRIARGTLLTSAIDFVMLNNEVVAATDRPISPGNPLSWDDTVYAATFLHSTLNNYGEYAIGGLVNSGNPAQDALVMFYAAGKATQVLAEGEPIDVNGDGLANDDAFLSIFDDDTMTVTDGNIAYLAVEMVNSSATYIGDAVIEVYLPLTGDVDNSGEVDAADIDYVISQFGSADPAADCDGSGEVDAADIDIVIANFGRTR
ncbi:MAG: hypothetical protein JNK63_08135 [Chthonomonas sp.]|nr:hypothetical protein [Chthonomonas sp.]